LSNQTELEIGSLASAAEKELGLTLPYSIDAISALYKWGSQSIHSAYRMPTCEIWAAWIAANNINSINVSRARHKRRETQRYTRERQRITRIREQIIDRFVEQGKVALMDRSTLDLMSVSVNNSNNRWFISLNEETYKRFNRYMEERETQGATLKRILDIYDKTVISGTR
jgi:hypothetical protein